MISKALSVTFANEHLLFSAILTVPPNRISAILRGRRGISADTALRLARYFGTSPQLWMNLQKAYELRVAEFEWGKHIEKRVKPRQAAA